MGVIAHAYNPKGDAEGSEVEGQWNSDFGASLESMRHPPSSHYSTYCQR